MKIFDKIWIGDTSVQVETATGLRILVCKKNIDKLVCHDGMTLRETYHELTGNHLVFPDD